MKNFVVWSMVCAMIALAGCSKEQKGAPVAKPVSKAQEGSPAPDFTLRDLNGGEVRLSSLRGKVVLLNFWATWCPPCREEVPSMVKLNRAMAGKQFQMLAVSIDEGGKPAIEAFFKESKSSLPALLDTDGSTGKRYGLTGVPETFVIDTKGVIMKKVIGPMDWSDPAVISYLSGLMKN
jgi:peroxiredoxin